MPNIEGGHVLYSTLADGDPVGAFYTTRININDNTRFPISGRAYDALGAGFKASLSNPIYGNSDHVIPESNDWIVCVVAFGTATNTGSVDVANVMSAVGTIQADIATKLDNDTIHVIETWKSEDGTSWYRKYSDGWIEQGGISEQAGDQSRNNITLATPFSRTDYSIMVTQRSGVEGSYSNGFVVTDITQTAMTIVFRTGGDCRVMWYAFGY